jgi:hypothetical protein
MYDHFPFAVAERDSLAKDIDILVTHDESEQLNPEDIKRCIVDADSRYYLRPSNNPSADYKVLFCHLPTREEEASCQSRYPDSAHTPPVDS